MHKNDCKFDQLGGRGPDIRRPGLAIGAAGEGPVPQQPLLHLQPQPSLGLARHQAPVVTRKNDLVMPKSRPVTPTRPSISNRLHWHAVFGHCLRNQTKFPVTPWHAQARNPMSKPVTPPASEAQSLHGCLPSKAARSADVARLLRDRKAPAPITIARRCPARQWPGWNGPAVDRHRTAPGIEAKRRAQCFQPIGTSCNEVAQNHPRLETAAPGFHK